MAARAVVIIDELGAASLTEIARISGRGLSTVQRAVSTLAASNVLAREWERGPFTFAPGAPKGALRELADWTLGPTNRSDLIAAIHQRKRTEESDAPATITNPRIRRAWPHAIRRIITTYHPRRVVLFGSQARGDSDLQSDVDLLVVFDKVPDRRERSVQITRLLRDMPFAKDVLVAGADDVSHPLRGSALADAVKTGLVVYER
jgi:predicted nucleotidyltransferase